MNHTGGRSVCSLLHAFKNLSLNGVIVILCLSQYCKSRFPSNPDKIGIVSRFADFEDISLRKAKLFPEALEGNQTFIFSYLKRLFLFFFLFLLPLYRLELLARTKIQTERVANTIRLQLQPRKIWQTSLY